MLLSMKKHLSVLTYTRPLPPGLGEDKILLMKKLSGDYNDNYCENVMKIVHT